MHTFVDVVRLPTSGAFRLPLSLRLCFGFLRHAVLFFVVVLSAALLPPALLALSLSILGNKPPKRECQASDEMYVQTKGVTET